MASKYDTTRKDVADGTERVRSLTAQGKAVEATDLVAEVKESIRTLPARERAALRRDLEQAAESTPSTDVATISHENQAPEVPQEIIDDAVRAIIDGVRQQITTGRAAEVVARKLQEFRMVILNSDGVPDLRTDTQEYRDRARATYELANTQLERTEESAESLDKFMWAVQRVSSDVLVERLKSLTEADFAKYFPTLVGKYPGLSPTEAVYTHYESIGRALPRKGRKQLDRERKAANKRALESGQPLEDTNPEQTLSVSVARLQKSLSEAEKALPALETMSEDIKGKIRKDAEHAEQTARKIIIATS